MVSRCRLHNLPAIDFDANFPALLFLASGRVKGAHPSGSAREDRGDIAPPRLSPNEGGPLISLFIPKNNSQRIVLSRGNAGSSATAEAE